MNEEETIKGPKPGYYESHLKDYPGYIQFPYPFLYHHFKAWWEKAITPLKGMSRVDFKHADCEWQGAKELLLEFGEWAIEGVPVGDAKTDNLPFEVMSFICDAANDYITPKMSLKKQLGLSAIS